MAFFYCGINSNICVHTPSKEVIQCEKQQSLQLCSAFWFACWPGYYAALWRGEQHPAETEAHAVLEEKKRIHAGTKIVYQYFYTQDRVMKKHIEPAPEFLQGLDLEQLKSIYTGWQVVFFSSEQVILRCSIEGMSDEVYVLGEDEGFLAVFYEDGKKQLRLKERTELPLSALPDGEARQLQEGMRVIGEENLAKVLADFMS